MGVVDAIPARGALWSSAPAPCRLCDLQWLPGTGPGALSAIHADPGARHSVADLAGHAGLSPRHLQRRFTAEIGSPPAAYVERVRIEAAQRALTETDDPVATVARRCGFGTAETLRRAFHRNTSVAPSDYRDRFRSAREMA